MLTYRIAPITEVVKLLLDKGAELKTKDTKSDVPVVGRRGRARGGGGFTGAGYAVQPEDAFFVMPISTCHYVLEDVDLGVGKAKRITPLVAGVEGCLGSAR